MSFSKVMGQRTLLFDNFGDLILERDDLKVIGGIEATIQIITDFFKTSYGDYLFYPEFGANYDQFIGKSIDSSLVSDIVGKVSSGLKKLDILPDNAYKVYGMASGSTIQIRVILVEDDDYTIYLNIDTVKGVSLGN